MGVCASCDAGSHEPPQSSLEIPNSQHTSTSAHGAVNGYNNSNSARGATINGLHTHKLLLLGTGESGKSTLFKQITSVYGSGYSTADRTSFLPAIHNNILTSIRTLCQQSDLYAPIQDPNVLPSKAVCEKLLGDEDFTSTLLTHIAALWSDRCIRLTYTQRSHFHLMDNAAYFFDRLATIGHSDYIPTVDDIMHARVRTTGIVEKHFELDNTMFTLIDVGGQRNERKKWIHCFEHVSAVLFVAALSEYDQLLYEDEQTNRVMEAVNLFEEICASRWFHQSSIILFLNKRDIFQQKLNTIALGSCFPQYNGDNSYESCVEFMQQLFLSRVTERKDATAVYVHVCCATDSENMRVVMDAVKKYLINRSLKEANLM